MIKIEYYQSNLGVFIKNEWSMNSLYINDIPFTEGIARKGFRQFNTRTKAYDSVQIFEMTWAGYRGNGGYEGYTCIPALEGSSLKDISERLKYYLETLMEEINKELDKCSCCNGYGYVVKSISSNFEKEWGNGNTDNFLPN